MITAGRVQVIYLAILVFSFISTASADALVNDDDDQKRNKRISSEYITPGWVVVKFKPDIHVTVGASKTGIRSVDAIGEKYQILAVEKFYPTLDLLSAQKRSTLKGLDDVQRIYKMQYESDADPQLVAASLSLLSEVAYAEPLYREKISSIPPAPAWFTPARHMLAVPNDPRYQDQDYFGSIAMETAWDLVVADTGDVVVAIVDGGVFWTHEDLEGTLWSNPGEIAGNGEDDDGNGFVDDIRGWNFWAQSGDPKGSLDTPVNAQHGTQTAGLVAAHSDNGIGLAGTSWNASYMPVTVGCESTDLAICFSLEGIMYAASNGADIINASFGSSFMTRAGQDFVDFAYANGSLIIAPAGNTGSNNDLEAHYPADYNHVLSVGATDKMTDQLTEFSNFGVSVDLFAPGNDMLSTSPFNGYLPNSGTSFSAPMVAGVAALLKTQNPSWGPDQIREQLRATADDISAVNTAFQGKMGKGRLNATRALSEVTPSVRIVGFDIRDANGSKRIDPGEDAFISIDITNYLAPVTDLSITLETLSEGVSITQGTTSVPVLNAGDTTTVSFELRPSFDVAQNLDAVIIANFSSGSYTDIDAFPKLINSTTHDTGNIQVTLTDQGNLGYEDFQDNSAGKGFRYLGFDFLFEGGLITGNSPGTVSDNIRGENEVQQVDFVQEEGSVFGIIDGRETTEEGALELIDSNAEVPLGIKIRQDSYADTSAANRDFVILKYTFENLSETDIVDYYAGLFLDWDSFTDPGADYVRFDEPRKMGYFLNTLPEHADVFLATRMLTDNEISFRAVNNPVEIYGNSGQNGDPNNGFTEEEKWAVISNGIQTTSLDATDVSTLLSAGPFDLAPGESVEVAFAVIGATSQSELETHADAAQSFWDNTLSLLGPNPVANEEFGNQPAFTFGLSNPYPNPATRDVTVDFELSSPGEVQLKIYDMLGREVSTLIDAPRQAGKYQFVWGGEGEAGQRLASGVYMISLKANTEEGLKSATQKLVMVR